MYIAHTLGYYCKLRMQRKGEIIYVSYEHSNANNSSDQCSYKLKRLKSPSAAYSPDKTLVLITVSQIYEHALSDLSLSLVIRSTGKKKKERRERNDM